MDKQPILDIHNTCTKDKKVSISIKLYNLIPKLV